MAFWMAAFLEDSSGYPGIVLLRGVKVNRQKKRIITKTTAATTLRMNPIFVNFMLHSCLCVLASTRSSLNSSTLLSLFCLDIL